MLSKTVTDVTRLMDVQNDRRPDDLAHVRAHTALIKLVYLGVDVPANDVYVDRDKAIRLAWTGADRTVELVFPSEESELPYLYHSDEHDFGIEENPAPELSRKWLNWVSDGVLPDKNRAA